MKTRFDLDFVDRTLKTTGVVLLIAFAYGYFYFGFWNTMAFFSGGVWGMINLMLIKRLVTLAIRPDGIDTTAVIVMALVKFPLLYLSGYFLLTVDKFDTMALLYGFSSVLAIIVLKAAGRVMLGMDANGNNNPVQKVI